MSDYIGLPDPFEGEPKPEPTSVPPGALRDQLREVYRRTAVGSEELIVIELAADRIMTLSRREEPRRMSVFELAQSGMRRLVSGVQYDSATDGPNAEVYTAAVVSKQFAKMLTVLELRFAGRDSLRVSGQQHAFGAVEERHKYQTEKGWAMTEIDHGLEQALDADQLGEAVEEVARYCVVRAAMMNAQEAGAEFIAPDHEARHQVAGPEAMAFQRCVLELFVQGCGVSLAELIKGYSVGRIEHDSMQRDRDAQFAASYMRVQYDLVEEIVKSNIRLRDNNMRIEVVAKYASGGQLTACDVQFQSLNYGEPLSVGPVERYALLLALTRQQIYVGGAS